mmetsp:Transcript_37040/g.111548  ORF Transcript_37040/g.111548 Transcript_37040/m.111548 type:complete len:224 (+) Transcript_37040:94-765(+)
MPPGTVVTKRYWRAALPPTRTITNRRRQRSAAPARGMFDHAPLVRRPPAARAEVGAQPVRADLQVGLLVAHAAAKLRRVAAQRPCRRVARAQDVARDEARRVVRQHHVAGLALQLDDDDVRRREYEADEVRAMRADEKSKRAEEPHLLHRAQLLGGAHDVCGRLKERRHLGQVDDAPLGVVRVAVAPPHDGARRRWVCRQAEHSEPGAQARLPCREHWGPAAG